MWLVVYKEEYYPSVYEYESYEEAKQQFDKMRDALFYDKNDPAYVNEDGKLYIAEIKDSFGTNDEDVEDVRVG